MPRKRRYELVDIPQHVVQRGNNRQRTFVDGSDYGLYLDWLDRAARQRQCDIHAYVLMSNHVHLLVTPRAPMAIAALMQSLGRTYVRYFNARHQRSGTLWEGRHHASLVASGRYLMTCYRYIELNPVRAGLVVGPADYPWSSYRRNALGRPDARLVEHDDYTILGADPRERAQSYGQLFGVDLGPDELDEIRNNLNQCRAYGPDQFKDKVEAALGRPVRPLRTGRPRKAQNTTLTPGTPVS